MGCLSSAQFHAQFSADLRSLFQYYRNTVVHVKAMKLFQARTQYLETLVDQYLANPRSFDTKNADMCSIDMAHKLHPVDYCTSKVTRQWLINACLRQNTFISNFPFDCITFEKSYKQYVQFLYTCLNNESKIIVPNKMADFMWHSHMQDNYRYKIDSKNMLGRVLDHLDDIPEPQMKEHAKYTDDYRREVFKKPEKPENKQKMSLSGQKNEEMDINPYQYQFIDYGIELNPMNNNDNCSNHSSKYHHKEPNNPNCDNSPMNPHEKHHHPHKDSNKEPNNPNCDNSPMNPHEKHHHPHKDSNCDNNNLHHHDPHQHHKDNEVWPPSNQPLNQIIVPSPNHHHNSDHGHSITNTAVVQHHGHNYHAPDPVSIDTAPHHSSCGGYQPTTEAAHHSSCGGGHHSSCGGAVSSCGGGGASSCGGGASSCGGGGSSCGGS